MSGSLGSGASTPTTPATSTTFGHPISEKLTRDNYVVWKAQVLPAVRGARLTGYLDGTTPEPSKTIKVQKADKSEEEEQDNPAHAAWIAQDQQLLSYLLSTLSREILIQAADEETTYDLWKKLSGMYSSQSKARVIQIRAQLSREKKGELTVAAYFT